METIVGMSEGTRDTSTPFGDAYEETVRGGERLRVQVVRWASGGFGFVAHCGYQACDGPFRDTYASEERFDDADAALAAGRVKARQLAGIDVPEA